MYDDESCKQPAFSISVHSYHVSQPLQLTDGIVRDSDMVGGLDELATQADTDGGGTGQVLAEGKGECLEESGVEFITELENEA